MIFVLLAFEAFGRAPDVDAQVKVVAERYNEIEGQLGRSVHYVKVINDKSNNVIETRQAWLNEAGDPLKVSLEEKGKQNRKLTEIFLNGSVIFVLDRSENTMPGGSIHVNESRKYFGKVEAANFSSDNALMRELKKEASFKPGDPLDTVHVKNIPVNIDPAANQEDYEQKADDIRESVMREAPVNDPSAKPSGDSKKYLLMEQTVSPNGRYALGLGPDKKPLNYVVALDTHRILGSTGCHFDGTRKSYNTREDMVAWSPNSTVFIQATCWKWYSDTCRAGLLADGKLMGTIDLLHTATNRAYEFLASHKDPAFKKHGREFAITIDPAIAHDDGTVELDVDGEIPKDLEEDSSFTVTEHFRIKNSANGLIAVPLDVSYTP